MKTLLVLLALVCGTAAAQSVTIPAQVITLPVVAPSCVVIATLPAQTLCGPGLTVSNTPPVVTPPVVVGPPAAGVAWVYHNGVFNWPGAYNFNATVSYTDTAGKPPTGTYDIAVTPTRWGAWQPAAFLATGSPFNTSGYKYLIYSVKPTAAGQVFATGFDANNDVADGVPLVIAGPGITKYGPVPVVGQWTSYTIPLADFGFTNPLVLKFTVADGSGSAALFYVTDVGFKP